MGTIDLIATILDLSTGDIKTIADERKRLAEKIQHAKSTLAMLEREDRDLEAALWQEVQWDDMEAYMRNHPQLRTAARNRLYGFRKEQICQFVKGQMTIGDYINNDHFPRGKAFFVRKDLERW